MERWSKSPENPLCFCTRGIGFCLDESWTEGLAIGVLFVKMPWWLYTFSSNHAVNTACRAKRIATFCLRPFCNLEKANKPSTSDWQLSAYYSFRAWLIFFDHGVISLRQPAGYQPPPYFSHLHVRVEGFSMSYFVSLWDYTLTKRTWTSKLCDRLSQVQLLIAVFVFRPTRAEKKFDFMCARGFFF